MVAEIEKRTQEQTANSMAQSLPTGRLFCAANIDDSNLRRLLEGLAVEIWRIEGKIANDVYEQYFVNEGNDGLLEEWESHLGIPDDCLKIEGKTRAERVEQVILKLGLDKLVTEQDYIDLAAAIGIIITIDHGIDPGIGSFPFVFPFFLGDAKYLRHLMIVNMPVELKPSSVFPVTFPFTFGEGTVLECLFNKIKDASILIQYRYIL